MRMRMLIFLSVLWCGSAAAMGSDHTIPPSADINASKTLKHLVYAFQAKDIRAFKDFVSPNASVELKRLEWIKRPADVELTIHVDDSNDEQGAVEMQVRWYCSYTESGQAKVVEGRSVFVFEKSRSAKLVGIEGVNPFLLFA